MDDEPNLDDTPPTKRMKIPPSVLHLLPNELLVKVIEKLPRPQWPHLELIDRKFRDATLLAWGSIREVDMETDFICTKTKTINDDDSEMVAGRLNRQIARKTKAILKKLSERSPFITSLCGLSLICCDPTLNTTAVRYLSEFKHLETIKFVKKSFRGHCGNGDSLDYSLDIVCGIPLTNLVEFVESTQSRATLKEISIAHCNASDNVNNVAAHFDRLQAAFSNDSNDPTRQLLRLESFSMGKVDGSIDLYVTEMPLSLLGAIDASRMTSLSLKNSDVEPAILANLINGAPHLHHLDFAFLKPCSYYGSYYGNTTVCRQRLQPNRDLLAALGSHLQLTSLGSNSIWNKRETCACHRFETEFKKMLRTIGPQLMKIVFTPGFLPPDIRMGEVRDIIQNHMPRLKSITLDKCCVVNPEDLRGIADGKELEEIEIARYNDSIDDENYITILDEVLSTIINKSPRLKRFSAVNCYPDQRMVAELCKLPDLTDLRIHSDRLTKENFVAFSQQAFAEKLQVLHLAWIRKGAESGLIELIGKATQLRELVVHGTVAGKLLQCLADSCSNLEKFRAIWVDNITMDGAQMLVDRCPKLQCLDVNNSTCTLKRSFIIDPLKLDRYRNLEFN